MVPISQDVIFAQVIRYGDFPGVHLNGDYVEGVFGRMDLGFTSARESNEMTLQLKGWVHTTPEGVAPLLGDPAAFPAVGFDLPAEPGG